MNYAQGNRRQVQVFLLVALCFACFVLVPALSFAQESDLAATIRAALLSDSETANLSQAELDAMVAALAAEAEAEGVTSEDIAWRPMEVTPAPEYVDTCGNLPGFLCALNESLGFAGGNALIPLWLFISSLALLLLLKAMAGISRKTHMSSATPGGELYF